MNHKPGRKPLAEGQSTASVHVRIPERLHDDVCKVALRQGVSVSSVLRVALLDWLKHQQTGACLWL